MGIGNQIADWLRNPTYPEVKYGMWLSWDGGQTVFPFAQLPEKITVKTGTKTETVSIAGLGEIAIRQGRPAITISFSSFFPKTAYQGADSSKLADPILIVQELQQKMENKEPARFASTSCNLNMYVIIESLQFYEKGGDVGTLWYDITLKEYREVSARWVDLEQMGLVDTQPRIDNTVKPNTYIVQDGDCLWNIAQRFYGDGWKYIDIFIANMETLHYNIFELYTGTVLVLP